MVWDTYMLWRTNNKIKFNIMNGIFQLLSPSCVTQWLRIPITNPAGNFKLFTFSKKLKSFFLCEILLNLKKVLYQWKYYNYNIIIIIMLCSSTLILTNVPYCLKNVFSIYSNKKTHPIQTPLYPLWLWFEQAWTRTPWGVSTV